MAKKGLLTINGTYRKIKKGFVTVDGSYRKVKKAFITIGGVYRPCWSSGLEYFGGITPLSVGVYNLAAASTKDYAFFACGRTATGTSINSFSKTIDVYDKTLTRTSLSLANMVVAGDEGTTTSLNSREDLSGASVNELAIFGGGARGETHVNDVFAIRNGSTLLRMPQGQYMSTNWKNCATTTVGNHVLFANGMGYSAYYRRVDAYDSSMTKTVCATTTHEAGYRAASTVGNYAIIAGGQYGVASTTYDKTIDVYDSSLTKITTGIALSVGRSRLSATTVKGHALFAGGTIYGDRQAVVDSFNESLTHSTSVAPLSEARADAAAVTIGELALFLGGQPDKRTATVDTYDGSLVHTVAHPLAEGRESHAAATVGDFVLVGGGTTESSTYSTSVEAYIYS